MLKIDGSCGEGGGQVLRSAVALSALTGQDMEIVNIRSRRNKQGLAAQHLTGVRGVAELCGARVEGDAIGSTRLVFRPGRVRGGEYELDVKTAGSITLVLQTCLLAALRADTPVTLTIRGGTNVRMSPPVDYYQHVLLPLLQSMGVDTEMEVLQRGFYPQGGGVVRTTLVPPRAVLPLDLEKRGRLEEMGGVCFVQNLPDHVATRMAHAIGKSFLGGKLRLERVSSKGPSTGAGAFLFARYDNTILGADALGEKGVPAERVGIYAAERLRAELEDGGTLDVHAADQLLPYLALASGPSAFRVRELSSHLLTQIELVPQFLPVEIIVEREGVPRIEVRPNRTW
ncbi:MAG: RNA 3'-phosphate cyclase [Euryarchaeota archaeon]|nr:RNA 3'-phosphate cyclase [Euryarchaeota archaeon]